jgi:hypothetical protein
MEILRISMLIAILTFAAASAATYLNVLGPVSGTIYNNGSIYLGRIAPGESFYILANASTDNSTGAYINIGWDSLKTIDMPNGWSSQSSPLYENPMKMKVTVSPDTPIGNYSIVVRAINVQNYSHIGNLTFTAFVNVTPDVFSLEVTPLVIHAGLGQPAVLGIIINNTGISDDPFVISARGLPAWNVSEQAISLHGTVGTFTYPIFLEEPGAYTFNLTVNSATSPLVTKSYPITFYVNESLPNDYAAVGQGAAISPVIFEPAYAFMSFLSYIYSIISS